MRNPSFTYRDAGPHQGAVVAIPENFGIRAPSMRVPQLQIAAPLDSEVHKAHQKVSTHTGALGCPTCSSPQA